MIKSSTFPVNCTELTNSEMAEIFCRVANKEITYQGTQHLTCIYNKIDRDEYNRVTYFHYWIFYENVMYKLGSGGYIPLLHTNPREIIYEFEIKEFNCYEPKKITN